MMNLVSRCSERTPDVLASTASESPVKTRHESQSPLSLHLSLIGDKQVISLLHTKVYVFSWKADELMDDRTGTPVVCPQRGARPQQFIIGDEETELELSFGSRSFLDRVNDQVRKKQKRSSMNVTENDEKHSVIWRMFMSSTLQSSVFIMKNYSGNWHSIKNTQDLTMKQMFDISEKLVSEQSDEIY